MDQKIQNQTLNKPDYRKIYQDLITKKFPEKWEACSSILRKDHFSLLDILAINKLISDVPEKEISNFNQKHRSYDDETIEAILAYQKKHHLNNSELAQHFKLSRNTVTKWKKLYKPNI